MYSKKMGNQIARLLPDKRTAYDGLASATWVRPANKGGSSTSQPLKRLIGLGSAAERIGSSFLSANIAAWRWCARLAPMTPTVEEAVR
jgi:hypothetical protein